MIFTREKVKQKRERTEDRLPLVFPVHPLSLTAFTSPASALLIWLWWFLSSSSPSFYLDLIHTPSTPTTHSTPTPFLIPAFLSLFFPLSGVLTIHLHPPTPFLSIVTAACLMVRLLSRSTTQRPGEQPPRLTPPDHWPYQDWQRTRPRAIANTHTCSLAQTIAKIHACTSTKTQA